MTQPGVTEASEGPRMEEAEVVVAGEGERRTSGRECRDSRASWDCHRLFFILRNCERTRVKGNMPLGLIVHRPSCFIV
jgi:hypothetical protein